MITNAKENTNSPLTAKESAEQYSPKLKNEKKSVPGQQIGLYNEGATDDVNEMVNTLNNPGESSQDDRG